MIKGKKITLGILLALGIIILIFSFRKIFFPDYPLGERIRTHKYYLIFLCFSYIFYLILSERYEEKWKKANKILLGTNIFVFLYIFFRESLFLSIGAFILLSISLVGIILSPYIDQRLRKGACIFFSLIAVLSLCSGFFEMYDMPPNEEDFLSSQKIQLITSSLENKQKNEMKIELKSDFPQEFLIKEGYRSYDLPEKGELIFSSKEFLTSDVFLSFPGGIILQIFPQTQLSFSYKEKPKISILKGKIQLPEDGFQNSEISGKYEIIENENLSFLQEKYQKDQKEFFKKQLGNTLQTNYYMQKINELFLKILVILHPVKYSQNLKNFYAFQSHFGNQPPFGFSPYFPENISIEQTTIKKNLLENAQIGEENINNKNLFFWLK